MTGLHVTHPDDHVAQLEIRRPPHNYFDVTLIAELVAAFGALAEDGRTRAVVLCSTGRHFCAGADFRGAVATVHPEEGRHLYDYGQAAVLGLVDDVVPDEELRAAAVHRARRFAQAAPLAVRSVRATMRAGLVDAVRTTLDRERDEQTRLMATADWREGVAAARERRTADFVGA